MPKNIVVLGNAGVGKTSLIHRLVNSVSFSDAYRATKEVTVERAGDYQFVDTPGELYPGMVRSSSPDPTTNAYIIVIDGTSDPAVQKNQLREWMQFLARRNTPTTPLFVVFSKSDTGRLAFHPMSEDDLQESYTGMKRDIATLNPGATLLVDKPGYHTYSAKTDENIEELLKAIRHATQFTNEEGAAAGAHEVPRAGSRSAVRSSTRPTPTAGLFSQVEGQKAYWKIINNPTFRDEALATSIARLFNDYDVKGSGWRRYAYFHARRTHMPLARIIARELFARSTTTPQQIQQTIQRCYDNYNMEHERTEYKRGGAFWRRCQFALDLCSSRAGAAQVRMGEVPLEVAFIPPVAGGAGGTSIG